MGCDISSISIKISNLNFNPRTRVGCDLDAAILADRLVISIHAPAWGATPDLSGAYYNL